MSSCQGDIATDEHSSTVMLLVQLQGQLVRVLLDRRILAVDDARLNVGRGKGHEGQERTEPYSPHGIVRFRRQLLTVYSDQTGPLLI